EGGRPRPRPDATTGRTWVSALVQPPLDGCSLLPPLLRVDLEGQLDVATWLLDSLDVEIVGTGHVADRGFAGVLGALDPADDPLEHPGVLRETRPQDATVVAAAEPVDVEDLGQLAVVGLLTDVQPVTQVVAR